MNFFQFLNRLDAAKLHYDLGRFRDSVAVQIAVPGAYWEVEFFEDGHIELEIFKSQGGVEADAEAAIERLFREQSN
jgi:hypothetical protein